MRPAPTLRDALRVAARFSDRIVLNLGHVRALDAGGLDVLSRTREQLRSQQETVLPVAAENPVRATLQRAGPPEAFLLVERAAEAIAALTGMGHDP